MIWPALMLMLLFLVFVVVVLVVLMERGSVMVRTDSRVLVVVDFDGLDGLLLGSIWMWMWSGLFAPMESCMVRACPAGYNQRSGLYC